MELYPHPSPYKRFLDKSIYVIGVLGPLFGSIQAYKIFSQKSAEAVSMSMFAFSAFADIWWLLYGVAHKDIPIVVVNTLWLIVNLLVVAGILIYS